MIKNNDRTAIKLLNKYADSHKALEEENKALRSEITDLKTSVKLNKEIIENLIKETNNQEMKNSYISKLKEEIKGLNIKNEKLIKEKEHISSKLYYFEQVTNETTFKEKEEYENMKTKYFIMENLLENKESMNQLLSKKLLKYESIQTKKEKFDKVIYVIEPSKAVNLMYDDLNVYKNVYENLTNYIKLTKRSNINLEKALQTCQDENMKIREKYKNMKSSSKILNTYNNQSLLTQKKSFYSNNKSVNTVINAKEIKISENGREDINYDNYSENTNYEKNNTQNNRRYDFRRKDKSNDKLEDEDWMEIMRSVNLRSDEYEKFLKNKSLTKLFDVIEMLKRLLDDKNLQINILEKENQYLNEKNRDLNNENISLIAKNNEFLTNFNNLKTKFMQSKHHDKTLNHDNTNSNNIMIQNLNINSNNAISQIYDPLKQQINELDKMKIFSPAFSKEINKFQGYQENSLPDWIVDTTKQNLNKNNNFTINNQAFRNHHGGTLDSISSSDKRENIVCFDSGFVSLRNEIEKLNVDFIFSKER